jgi:subtilisin-like proprotein convertase family protein
MDYSFPHLFRRRAIACLLGAWSAFSPLAFAADGADEITVIDHGQQHTLVIADREVYVARRKDAPLGELRQLVERVPGTKVVFDTDTRALVQLGAKVNRLNAAAASDEVSLALPDAEVQPVLYVKDAAHGEASRRYFTSTIMVSIPEGTNLAQLAKTQGAIDAQATSQPGLALLKYATPFKALEALQQLRADGVGSEPLLAQQMQKRSQLPKDQFFSQQWHLLNYGQGGGTPGIDANILGAWDFVLGQGRTIAIVDDCLQTTHPDLTQNCPPIGTNLHHDFIDNDNDPKPGPNDQHGTSCAGVAAARQNNGIPDQVTGALLGVSGVAPNARLFGLRLIAGPFTDSDSASALYWHPTNNGVDVSSNSWGPTDGGGFAGPDILTLAALKQAVQEGRGGLGQVTVWAAGNGLEVNDNANFDGYANSRFVTAVSAIDNFGDQAFYSEPGANILVCAPSNGGSLSITTTDLMGVGGYNPAVGNGVPDLPNTDYTDTFGGTSSACPLVAGGAALILNENANLSWRDVREILASTSRKIFPGDGDWTMRIAPLQGQDPQSNDGGFHFNHKFGAGLIDLAAAVARAKTWENLPAEVSQTAVPIQALPFNIPSDGSVQSFKFDLTANPNLRVETVELKVLIKTLHRSDLQVELISPSGVRSILSPQRPRPDPLFSFDNDQDVANWVLDAANGQLIEQTDGWTFTSTHYWGDNSKTTLPGTNTPTGVWTLTVANKPFPSVPAQPPTKATISAARLTVYGTASVESRIVFDDGSAGDVIESAGSKTIRVRRLGPLTGEATVDFATTIGSAVPDNIGDPNPRYTPVSGTLHFSDGKVFADTDIVVPILDDTIPEVAQTVNLVLTHPTNATLGRGSFFSFRILDDEQNLVTVTATDPIAAETPLGQPPNTGTFRIQREVASDQAVTVNFTFTGTATMGTGPNGTGDFNIIPLSATIPAFETSVDVVITPRDDTVIEGTETVIINLTPDGSYQLGDVITAQIDLQDNDRQEVQLSLPFAGGDLAAENPTKTTTVRVTRARENPNFPQANPLTVLLDYAGTQINGVNYQLLPTSIVIPGGKDFVDLTVVPINDDIYQATKTIVVKLRPSVDYDVRFGFLTSVLIRVLEDDPIPDTHIPTVTIGAPKKGSKYPAPQATFTASGTASDNGAVDQVRYRLNNGSWQLANLSLGNSPKSVAWSADILAAVQRGPNSIDAQSVDDAGNFSKIASSTFEYVELHTLALVASPAGAGTFTKGFAPASQRESGKTYTITASAADGKVFDHWSGLLAFGFAQDTSTSRTLTITMPITDATLTANFVDTPYVAAVAGTYSGLVAAPVFGTESSGFLVVTVNSSGFYSGKLTYGGTAYPVKGDFTGSGLSQFTIQRKKLAPLIVSLTIDTTDVGGTRRITGSINTTTATSSIVADRAAYNKSTNPFPLPTEVTALKYTVMLPPANPLGDPQHDPHGTGIGTLSIGADGTVKLTGTLADGTKFSQTQPLTKDNTWALFANLYKGNGVLLGNVALDSAPVDSDLHGTVNWQKLPHSTDEAFPVGFSIVNATFLGSLYQSATPVLDFGPADNNGVPIFNGVAVLTQGNLQVDLLRSFSLAANNTITVRNTQADPNATGLSLTINVKNGTYTGKFIHPISLKKTTLNGVIFQKQNEGFGQFFSHGVTGGLLQSGTVLLEEAP